MEGVAGEQARQLCYVLAVPNSAEALIPKCSVPTLLLVDGYRFFFFSNEGTEPPHVHVERGDGYAKFWLEPVELSTRWVWGRVSLDVPQQFFWARTMRGSDPLHVLLSYRDTGPSAQASAAVNRRLLQHLKAGDPFVKAWKKAHSASSQSHRWAASCHEDAVDDTLADWIRLGHLPSRPDPKGTILYFDSDTPHGRAAGGAPGCRLLAHAARRLGAIATLVLMCQ